MDALESYSGPKRWEEHGHCFYRGHSPIFWGKLTTWQINRCQTIRLSWVAKYYSPTWSNQDAVNSSPRKFAFTNYSGFFFERRLFLGRLGGVEHMLCYLRQQCKYQQFRVFWYINFINLQSKTRPRECKTAQGTGSQDVCKKDEIFTGSCSLEPCRKLLLQQHVLLRFIEITKKIKFPAKLYHMKIIIDSPTNVDSSKDWGQGNSNSTRKIDSSWGVNRSSIVWLLVMDAASRIKLWSKQLKTAEIRRFERPQLVETWLKVPTFDCEKEESKDLLKIVLSPKDWKVLS